MGSDPHGLLILGVSVAALLVGPGIHRVARREPVTMAALDNFVLVAVVGLVFLEILPGALHLAGLPALLALLVGVLGPALADGPLHRAAHGTHRAALALAVLGMALHSFTDGLALASAHAAGSRSHALEVAVIAHQLPVAVAVWWLLSPAGPLRASAAMLLLGLATVLGFLLADQSLDALAPAWLGLLQGLFAGLLLHVIAHRTAPRSALGARTRVAAGLGGLGGLGLLALLVRDAGHAHDGDPLARVLLAALELARAAAPALLLALAVAAGLAALAPAAGPRLWTALARGLARPAADPHRTYRELLRRGAPATAALTALVAAPTLGLDALLLSLPLLGGGLTLARALAGLLLALALGRVVGGLADRRPVTPDMSEAPGPEGHAHSAMSEAPGPGGHARSARPEAAGPAHVHAERSAHAHDPANRSAHAHAHGPARDPDAGPRADLRARARAGLRAPLELLDARAPWLVFGLLLAATLEPWLAAGAVTAVPPALQVVLLAALGVPARLCAVGSTPLVAVLLARGLSPGAGLAFLLTGPATSLATAGLLARLHGPRVARLQVAGVLALAVTFGLTLDLLAPDLAPPARAGRQACAADLALVALAGLCLVSFLRQTPQQFLRRLWTRDDAPHTHAPGP